MPDGSRALAVERHVKRYNTLDRNTRTMSAEPLDVSWPAMMQVLLGYSAVQNDVHVGRFPTGCELRQHCTALQLIYLHTVISIHTLNNKGRRVYPL